VNQYLQLFNATEAYMRVYQPKSRDVAASNGYKLLRKAEIAEAIDQRISEDAMRPAEVLKRLGEQARNEQSAYVTRFGVDMNRLIADGKAHLIKAIKHTANGDNIEFYDAQAALVQIGKAHGLFADRTEVTGKDGGDITLRIVYDSKPTAGDDDTPPATT